MPKRFQYVQRFEENIDFDTVLGGNQASDFPNEPVRRLTIVEDAERPHAYLTMADYSEREITDAEARQLLTEDER